jgi:hypothetical protein
MHEPNEKWILKFAGKPEGKRPLWKSGRILTWILRKWGVRVWNGYIKLRIVSSSRLL